MTVGAAVPVDLAALLREHRDELVEIWRRRVLSDPAVPEANRLAIPELVDHLPALKNSARRAERLVRDLVDMVRSRQGGGMTLALQRADLKDVCEDVVAAVNATHADRKIDLLARGGCEGRWDPDRIAQLVTNLLTNAVIYSPPDTTVTVEVGCREPRSVFLRVHNQGPPISADLMPCLFDPFRRGAGEPDRTHAGLGLGLHIARQIARAHGGDIQVESTAEAGTAFTVTLPRDATPT